MQAAINVLNNLITFVSIPLQQDSVDGLEINYGLNVLKSTAYDALETTCRECIPIEEKMDDYTTI